MRSRGRVLSFWTATPLATQRERQALKEEKYYPDKMPPRGALLRWVEIFPTTHALFFLARDNTFDARLKVTDRQIDDYLP
jgi:hypothetical protein